MTKDTQTSHSDEREIDTRLEWDTPRIELLQGTDVQTGMAVGVEYAYTYTFSIS